MDRFNRYLTAMHPEARDRWAPRFDALKQAIAKGDQEDILLAAPAGWDASDFLADWAVRRPGLVFWFDLGYRMLNWEERCVEACKDFTQVVVVQVNSSRSTAGTTVAAEHVATLGKEFFACEERPALTVVLDGIDAV